MHSPLDHLLPFLVLGTPLLAHCGGTTTSTNPSTDAGYAADVAQHADAPTHADTGTHADSEPPSNLPPPTDHRPTPTTCPSTRPPGLNEDGGVPDSGDLCSHDSQCTAGTNGRCTPNRDIPGGTCTYDMCTSDSDCAKGDVCFCGQPASEGRGPNVCLSGNCTVDSDCGDSGFCSPSDDIGGCGFGSIEGYYCHTPNDECTNDNQCVDGGTGFCAYDSTSSRWTCNYVVCAG